MSVTSKDIQYWLERATSLGAAGAEVLVSEREGTYIRVENGRVTGQKPMAEQRVQVTAFLEDGSMGIASSIPSDAGSAVAGAVAAAGDGTPDPTAGPVRGLRQMDYRELGIDDRRWPNIEMADRLDVVVAAERSARVDSRVHTHPFEWTDSRTHRQFGSTAGVMVEEFATRFRCSGGVRVAGDDAVIGMTDFVEGRSFATVSSLPFGANMAKRALRLLDDRIEISGPIRVMLGPRATAALFTAMADAFVSG
ncbi:MAG: putative Zn-dependent protease, partial [Myxococcota bacterium]